MKINIKLDKRYQLANGKYPVKLTIARNGKTLYIPVGVEVAEEDWDSAAKNQNYVRNRKDKTSLNMHIRSRLSQAEQAIRDLQIKGLLRQYDNKALVDYLSVDNTEREKRQFLSYQTEKYLATKKNKDTIDTYRSAVKAFSKHYDFDSFFLQQITKRFLEELRDKLIDDGLKTNTISNYITRIKSIYNFAYNNGDIDKPLPRINLKREETKKRSLLVEQLRQLKNGKLSRTQKKYVDVFFLMIYMRGINMKDLSELRLSDLRNGRIEYNRDKTGKRLEIKIEPEMQEIIDRYKGEKALLRFFDRHKPEEEYHKRFGNAMRQCIRLAAKNNGMEESLSAYWSRHTWSSLAIEIGIDIAYVSAGLSHSHGAAVTQTYVQYRQKRIDEDNRRVIDYILEKGEFANKS